MAEYAGNNEADNRISQAFIELSTALSRSDDPLLIADFLRCLLTKAEIREIAARWALVREIDSGTTQREIAREMGLSLCKITRGSKELKKDHSPFKQMIDLYLKKKQG